MTILKHQPPFGLVFKQPSTVDFQQLNHIFSDSYYRFLKMDDKPHMYFSGENLLNEFNYLVYTKSNQFIGYVKGYYPISGNHLWIQILAISKEYIRQGFGRATIQTLIHNTRLKGTVDKIYLTCHHDNLTGNYFWKSMGFVPTKTIKETHSLYEATLRSLTCIPNHSTH